METIELRQYFEPLRKWWWLLALSTLLAGISSAMYTGKQLPVYRSRTTVMVGTALLNPNPSGGELSLAAQLAAAYADIARRSTIREATQAALGLDRLPSYTAYLIPNTQLIEISVIDTSPERAQAVAAELANQLIQHTPGGNPQQERQTFLEEQLAQLEASIVETNEEIARLEQELAGLFSARRLADTRTQIDALELKVSTLQANYASLLDNSRQGASNTITIIDPAELPMEPMASDLATNTAVAALLGFALAAIGAYAMEYLDQSMRFVHEVARHLNLVILGAIPKMSRRELQKHGPLATDGPRTPVLDAYAALRLNVQAVLDDHPLHMLLVTSPGSDEGKSTIAANLAIDWARSGQTVILVDTDLYHPSQQRLFNLPNQSGLTTALVDPEMDLDELLKSTAIPGLSVLTSGPILPNPTPLLAQQATRNLLSALRKKADVIVLDTPPAAAVVDASILALQADGVLLVISAGKTKREMAKRAVELLQQIRARMLGVALFNAPLKHTLYKYYKHGYGGRVSLPETLGLHRDRSFSPFRRRDVVKSATLDNVNGHDRAGAQQDWHSRS
jgi:capsular exopolysaccharide synthesis family protein